jgi:hypothetical protein
MRDKNICFRIIDSVFYLTQGERSQMHKLALGHHQLRSRPSLRTVAQAEFLWRMIEDTFS